MLDHRGICLACVADMSLAGLRVARELDDVVRRRARADTIASDKGTGFTSMTILR
jgi:putative transposase